MINEKEFKVTLEKYKEDFDITWEDENYKWKAIKQFRLVWQKITDNFNDKTFAIDLREALKKTSNLLSSSFCYPRQRILYLAKEAPKEVYSMFVNLYNEDNDVYERISKFKAKSKELINLYPYKTAKKINKDAFQTENAITVYLWLRYPDKYYIYKYREIYNVVHRISDPKLINLRRTVDNVKVCMNTYDEMRSVILEDKDLCKMVEKRLAEYGYSNDDHHTLTLDIGFYISRYYEEADILNDAKYVKDVNDCLTKKSAPKSPQETTIKRYDRDPVVAARAIKKAGYKCECENNKPHEYFIRKTNGENYTEPHHLIPIRYQPIFKENLDMEENIISLCSNCHNWLHYGKDIDTILKSLYNKRKEWLFSMGIKSYNDLKKFY